MRTFGIRSYLESLRTIGFFLIWFIFAITMRQIHSKIFFWILVSSFAVLSFVSKFYKFFLFTPDGVTVYLQNQILAGSRFKKEAADSSLYRKYAAEYLFTDYGAYQGDEISRRLHVNLRKSRHRKFTLRTIPKQALRKVIYYPKRHYGVILLLLQGCNHWTERFLWQYRLHNRGKLLAIYVEDCDAPTYLRMLENYLEAQ